MKYALLISALSAVALAQSGPAGHWEGAIQVPSGDLHFQIDLAPDAEKGWIGTISIPAQGTKGLALNGIAVNGNSVKFSLKAPGDPQFQGTIDGEKMTGELSQGGGNVPFRLARTGDAKVEKPAKNPPLSKELEGTWQGALSVGDKQLRLRFELSNQAGAGTGVLISLDQGNSEIPIAGISQTGSHVKLDVPVVSGAFEGELKGASELVGQWSQGGTNMALTLTKAAK